MVFKHLTYYLYKGLFVETIFYPKQTSAETY